MPDLFFTCSLPGFHVLAMACLADKDWFDWTVAVMYEYQSICLSWRIWKIKLLWESRCYIFMGYIMITHTYIPVIHPNHVREKYVGP